MNKLWMLLAILAAMAAGCGAGSKSAKAEEGRGGALDTPGDHERRLKFGGRERYYELHVPPGYRKGTPAPVVLVFHGGGGHPAVMRQQTRLDAVADKNDFITVYPAGTGTFERRMLTFNTGTCCGWANEHKIDDVGFTRAILDDVGSFLSVDSKRVYATGISNGAIMSYTLACAMSDRIAAIAAIAGAMQVATCEPKRPVSVIEFHGALDNNIRLDGGVGSKSATKIDFPPTAKMLEFWIRRNGCPPEPRVVKKGGATARYYGPCQDGSEVVFWVLENGGHSWPGGVQTGFEKMLNLGPVSNDISASEELWEFFKRHPMR